MIDPYVTLTQPSAVERALLAAAIDAVDGPRGFALLLPYAFRADRTDGDLGDAAGAAAAKIMGRRLEALPTFDRAARSSPVFRGARWHLEPDALARVRRAARDPTTIDRLASMSDDGRVRELAVAQLGSESLAWLLVRATDWVAPVRTLAIERARAAVETATVPELLDVLLLAKRLGAWSRAERLLLASIRARLVALPHTVIATSVERPDARLRVEIARLFAGHATDADRLRPFLADRDPTVRLVAARTLTAGAASRELARRLAGDGAGAVRAIGLRLLVPFVDAADVPMLTRLVLDGSREVRWEAEVLLARCVPATDVRALALAALARHPTAGAVHALEAAGRGEDWEALFGALDAAGPTAVAAIFAMRGLDRSASRETRLMMVGDARPMVSTAASKSLVGELWDADRPILDSYLRSEHPRVRMNAAVLLRGLGARRWV